MTWWECKISSHSSIKHFNSLAKYLVLGDLEDLPMYKVVIPIGSLAATILSFFLSYKTQANIPSKCFGASMSYFVKRGMMGSQSLKDLNL